MFQLVFLLAVSYASAGLIGAPALVNPYGAYAAPAVAKVVSPAYSAYAHPAYPAYGPAIAKVAVPAIAKVAVADEYDPNPQYSYSYDIQVSDFYAYNLINSWKLYYFNKYAV